MDSQLTFFPLTSLAASSGATYLSTPQDVKGAKALIAELRVYDQIGTSPSWTVTLQHSQDLRSWTDVATYAVGVVHEIKSFENFMRWVRFSITLSGSNVVVTLSILGRAY